MIESMIIHDAKLSPWTVDIQHALFVDQRLTLNKEVMDYDLLTNQQDSATSALKLKLGNLAS